MKTIKKILFIALTFVLMVGIVNAESISDSFTIKSYVDYNTPLKFPYESKVKKTTTNKLAYCTYYSKYAPNGQTYTKGSLVTDSGINYILRQSLIENISSDDDYFIYQNALWIYMSDKGIMPGPHQNVKDFKVTVNNSSSSTATKIKNLVSAAKKASANDTSAPTIKIADTSNVSFTLSDGKYVSDKITVTSSTGDFEIKLTNAPSGTTYEKGSNYVRIIIPEDKIVSLNTSIEFSVNNSKDIYYVYNYNTSNSYYQPMAIPFKDTKTANDEAKLNLVTTTSVTISKQDIATSQELEGAKLKVTNNNGKIIDEWTSTKEPHLIKGLSAGTYTLTETIAPEGYVLSQETIKFTIDADGKLTDANGKEVDKIVMYNKKEEVETGVKISKQDVTNKQELPGAHLVVKDYDGNVIKEWISGTEPTYIKLEPGIYTLTETIAPDGYIRSDETITFTVKEDGTIDTVVMYNTPDTKEVVEVEDTASFKSVATTIVGLSIIVIGIGLIFKNKKMI